MATLINEQFSILSTKHSKPILADIRFMTGNDPMPLVIFCHGFKGFKDWGHFNHIASDFAFRGYIFLKFNFSHNGTTIDHPQDFKDLEAFGNNNISKELDDLGDIIDAIMEEKPSVPEAPVDKSKIFLLGHSRGGGIAILKAKEDKRVAGTCAWAPVDDFKKRYSGEILEQWKKTGVYKIQNSRTNQEMPLYYQLVEDIYNNEERTNIPNAVKKAQCPLMAIHGTKDETLDFLNTRAMKNLNTSLEVQLIEDATHTFGGSHPWTSKSLPKHTREAIEATDKFFRQFF
jgi:dienelactone hydrolase